jgi:transcriptional regulator
MDASSDELDSFKPAIEELAGAAKKAEDAAEKLNHLDENLLAIEKRIEQMQIAREWLAKAETRFEEVNKQVQEHVNTVGALLKDEGKLPPGGKGAPSIAIRENAVKLARQGWKVEEIAKALKRSRGEIELILELGLKD